MTLDGQIQRRVGRTQVDAPPMPVREPVNIDRAEDRGQRAVMPALHRAIHGAVSIDNLETYFAHGAQVQMLLKETTQQLSALHIELHFQLPVRQPVRPATVEPHQHLLETASRQHEPVPSGHDRCSARRAWTRATNTSSSPRAWASRSVTALR